MIVNLSEKYRANIDNLNHTLEKKSGGWNEKLQKEVSVYWSPVAYYPNMPQLIKGVVLEHLGESDEAVQLKEYCETVETLFNNLMTEAKEAFPTKKRSW